MTLGPLAYITAIVTDPEAAATALQRAFDLTRDDRPAGDAGERRPLLRIGATGLLLAAPGDRFVSGETRTGVHHIAIEASDVVRDAAALAALAASDTTPAPGATSSAFASALAAGLDGRRRIALDRAAHAGVTTHLTEPLSFAARPTAIVERFDHVGLASADNAAARRAFAERMRFPVESTQTDRELSIPLETFTSDKYGVVHKTRHPELVGALHCVFITVGDTDLEFLQDITPDKPSTIDRGAAGTTRQDKSAIGRYVATRGPGLHHLAVKVSDGQAALDRLAAAGLILIDRVPRPGGRASQIGFVNPKSLGGLLIHIVDR